MKTIIIAVAALAVGALAGYALPMFYLPANYSANMAIGFFADSAMSERAQEAGSKIAVLKRFRAGEEDKAIDILEHGLDNELIGLEKREDFASSTNNSVQKALAEAREYRTAFPRTAADPVMDGLLKKALNSQATHSDSAKQNVEPLKK